MGNYVQSMNEEMHAEPQREWEDRYNIGHLLQPSKRNYYGLLHKFVILHLDLKTRVKL